MGSSFPSLPPDTMQWVQHNLRHSWDLIWGQGPFYRMIALLLTFSVLGIVWRIIRLATTRVETEEDRIRQGQEVVAREKRRYGAQRNQ